MLTIITYVTLGLLIGNICGFVMAHKNTKTSHTLQISSIILLVIFMINALLMHYLSIIPRFPTNTLANYVMGSIAFALSTNITLMNIERLEDRLHTRSLMHQE